MKTQIKNLNNTKYIDSNSLNDKIINILMLNGCKSTSEKNIKSFLISFYKKSKKCSNNVVKHGIKNYAVSLDLKVIKRKKSVLKEIPFFIQKPLRIKFAIKNLKKKLLATSATPIKDKLLSDIFYALNNSSNNLAGKHIVLSDILKKKMQAHFRWF
jgi:ribosomal protein S7